MKVIASIGTNSIDLKLNFVENKPLIIMDDNLHLETLVVSNSEIIAAIVPGAKITYTLKDPKGLDNALPELAIVNIATVPNFYTKGNMDLLYIPSLQTLALVPNLETAITNNIGFIEIECISIGGSSNTDSIHPNVAIKHTEESIIKLGTDFSNVIVEVHVNNISGCVKNEDIVILTNYLSTLSGEIQIRGATPVFNITITEVGSLAFTESTYPASVMYPRSLINLKLKHMPALPKANKYVVVLV